MGGYPRLEVQVHVLEGGNTEVVPLSILDMTTLVGSTPGLQVGLVTVLSKELLSVCVCLCLAVCIKVS